MDISKILDSILPVLEQTAPTIASLAGGPIAGMAVSAVESALGLTPGTAQSDPAAFSTAIAGMTPEAWQKVRESDNALKATLAQLQIRPAEIAAADRVSARQMQIETRGWVPPILAFVAVGGFLALMCLVMFHPVPPESKSSFEIMLGVIGGWAAASYTFYFGSSAGSAAKDKMLYNSTPQA